MITGDKRELSKMADMSYCPDHPDKTLTVAWLQSHGYVIRCGAGHYPNTITGRMTPTKQYKTGEILPEKKDLDLMIRYDVGTNKDLPAAAEIALIKYADKYGLDAYRGHVMMMYGKPYIGIDGYLWHARTTNKPYTLNSRPLNSQERADMMIGENDHAWKSDVVILPDQGYFTGIGIVTSNEMNEKSDRNPDQLRAPVVAGHPWQLAQKRAEWQVLRRAFPIGEDQDPEED